MNSTSPATEPAREKHLNLARVELALAVVLVAIAVLSHVLFRLHAGALWRDEAGLVHVAMQPTLAQVWEQAFHEWMPLPVILLVRGWAMLGMGSSDGDLRTLGLLIGVASVPMIVLLMRSVGVRFAIWTLALWAINPMVIRAGDSLRGYGVGSITALLAMVTLIRWMDRPTWARWFAAVVGSIAAVQTLYPNSLVLLTIGVIGAATLAWQRRWKHAALALTPGFVAGLTLLPYLPILRHISEMTAVLVSPEEFGFGWFTKQAYGVIGFAGAASVSVHVAVLALATVACHLDMESSSIADKNKTKPGENSDDKPAVPAVSLARKYAYLMLNAGVPLYAVLLVMQGYGGSPWHLLPMFLLVAACTELCLGSWGQRTRWLQRVNVGAIAGMTLLTLPMLYLCVVVVPMSEMRITAAFLRSEAQPGDLVVVHPWHYSISLRHQEIGELNLVTVPPMPATRVHRYDYVRDAMNNPRVMEPLIEQVKGTVEQGNKVWLLSVISSVGVTQVPKEILTADFRVAPPPLPNTGWWVGPYNHAWFMQLLVKLHDAGLTVRVVRTKSSVDSMPLQEWMNVYVIEKSKSAAMQNHADASSNTPTHQGAH